MARFEEMTHRGRVVRGPITDLVELEDSSGARWVAICHHEGVRHDPSLEAGLDPVRDFLSLPMVEGLAALHQSRNGVFLYRVPPELRTLRELIGVFAEEGGGGERAACELVAAVGPILVSAAEAAADRGLQSHGSLDPWRIGVSPTGQVVVLGYGLPSLDGLAFQADERAVPRPDSLRYFPPERLDGEPEDVTSDLFVLALVAAELCSGVAVYGGPDLLDQVSAGEAPDRLTAVPPTLAKLLAPMLAPFADKRPRQPKAWIAAHAEAARRLPGRTLAELVREGAAYLSDVEEDLPVEVTVADLLGPEPEEPGLAELREEIAETLAATLALAESPEAAPTGVDESVPEVATAVAALGRAREAVAATVATAVLRGEEAVTTLEAGAVVLTDLALVRVELEAALSRRQSAAAEVTAAARRAEGERTQRLQQVVERAREAVARAASDLEAFGEDEEAETLLGTARAALRRADGARDPATHLRQLERAAAAADQVCARLDTVRTERSAAAAAHAAAVAEAERAALAAQLDAQRSAIRALVTGVAPDPVDADALAALTALLATADATTDPAALPPLEVDARRQLAALAQVRSERAALREAQLARARTRLGEQVARAEASAVDLDDDRVSAALAELRTLLSRSAEATTPEQVERLGARASVVSEGLDPVVVSIRGEREREREQQLQGLRERLAVAVARVAASTIGRTEPDMRACATEVEGLASAGSGDDPVGLGAAAGRAEELAAEAERLLARVLVVESARAEATAALDAGRADGLDLGGLAVDGVDTAPDPRAAAAAIVGELARRRQELRARQRSEQLTAGRTRLEERVASADQLVGDLEDPQLAAAVAELRSLSSRADAAEAPEDIAAFVERAEVVAEGLRVATEALRAQLALQRSEALQHHRDRVARAAERTATAASRRDEPELRTYAAAAAAASADAAADDPELLAVLAQRAEAAADAAEELLAEIYAEEDSVRAARLLGLVGRARKVEGRAQRLALEPAERDALRAAFTEVEGATDAAVAELALGRLEAVVASAEQRLAAVEAAAAEAKRIRRQERLVRAGELVAGVDALTGFPDDPMLVLVREELRQAVDELGACDDEAVAEQILGRIQVAAETADDLVDELRATAEAAEQAARQAAEEARLAELAALRSTGGRHVSAAPDVDEPAGAALRAALVDAGAALEAADSLPDAHAAVTRVVALSEQLVAHVREVAASREVARLQALEAARARLEALVILAGEPGDEPGLAEAVARLRTAARPGTAADLDALTRLAATLAADVDVIVQRRAQLEADAARALHEREALAAARARLAAATAAMDEHGESTDGDHPEVVALLGEALMAVADLADDAPLDEVDAVVSKLTTWADQLAVVRARLAETRVVEAHRRDERRTAVTELRVRAGRIADDLVESTIHHDDAGVASLLADTDRALDELLVLDDDLDTALVLLARVERNAAQALGAIERLEEDEQRREAEEELRAARMMVDQALATIDPVLVVLQDPELAARRAELADRAAAAGEVGPLQALIAEARALGERAHEVAAGRVEEERQHREEARRLAHQAVHAAQEARWLSARPELLDRVLALRAEIEQQPAAQALETARGMAARVAALDGDARWEDVRARFGALASAAAHLVGELPHLTDDVPAPLAAAVAAVRRDASAFELPALGEDRDVTAAEVTLAERTAQLAALEQAAKAATSELAGWRSVRIGEAVARAQAASARAWATWREASSIREDEALRAAVDEAEQACALVAGTSDPGDADWNAALAVAAADRAEEAAAALQDEVRMAIATLSTMQLVRDDAENALLAWGAPGAAGPEAELHHLWSRAESAARRGERAAVDAIGAELRALVVRIRQEAASGRSATPAPVMSLAERIQQAQRSTPGGKAVLAGPTLTPDGSEPFSTDTSPTLRPRGPGTPPPAAPKPGRPTLAPLDESGPVPRPASSETPSAPPSRPSVADLQARLRARASQRTTPPSGTAAPGTSDPPRPRVVAPSTPSNQPPASAPPRTPPPASAGNPTTGSVPPVTGPTRRLQDVPTAPRPIPRPPNAPPATPPSGAANPAAEARTTLMSRDDLEKVLAAALADDDDEEDEDGPPTTMFRPSDFGVDDDDPPEGY